MHDIMCRLCRMPAVRLCRAAMNSSSTAKTLTTRARMTYQLLACHQASTPVNCVAQCCSTMLPALTQRRAARRTVSQAASDQATTLLCASALVRQLSMLCLLQRAAWHSEMSALSRKARSVWALPVLGMQMLPVACHTACSTPRVPKQRSWPLTQ